MSSAAAQRVRWGIVGLGDVCERKSGPPLWEVGRSELTAVHRRSVEAAAAFVARHGHGRVADSYEELLAADDIDAIYVATPHALHAEHTVMALAAGKHVLVEKPMALSVADCDRMIDAAGTARRSLAVAYYRRGYPAVQRLRALVAAGAIGKPLTAAINAEFPTSHRIDLARFLFGDIAHVTIEHPPTAGQPGGVAALERMAPVVSLFMQNEITVRFAAGWQETGMPESVRVVGDAGKIDMWDLKGGHITVHSGGRSELIETGGLAWTHTGLVENVVAHLLDGSPLVCTGADGRASTAALEDVAEALTAAAIDAEG